MIISSERESIVTIMDTRTRTISCGKADPPSKPWEERYDFAFLATSNEGVHEYVASLC